MARSSELRVVLLVALLLATLAAVRLLAVSDWDPTVFTAFGEDAVEITMYAEGKLGRDVWTREQLGHDGRFFFVQANDPLILQPETNASVLDHQKYRSQRMLYPLVAGGAGLFPPQVIVWSLIVVNVVGLAVGSWAVGAIAAKHGASPWWGLAFLINVGLLSDLYIDGGGILAFALACLGALALEEERPGTAGALFAASVLAREVMLAFVGSVAVFWIVRKKTIPWLIAVPSGLAFVLWALYMRSRFEPDTSLDPTGATTAIPFSGLIEAVTSGRAQITDYLVMFVFVALMVRLPMLAIRSEVYLSWGAAGFAVLALFLSVVVWQKSFDISRALAPLLTAFLVEFAIARQRQLHPALV